MALMIRDTETCALKEHEVHVAVVKSFEDNCKKLSAAEVLLLNPVEITNNVLSCVDCWMYEQKRGLHLTGVTKTNWRVELEKVSEAHRNCYDGFEKTCSNLILDPQLVVINAVHLAVCVPHVSTVGPAPRSAAPN